MYKNITNTKQLGKIGEQLATHFLIECGHTILEQNYRCRTGEIDIISQDKEYLVFVEVKTRRSIRHGEPVEAITPHKQKKICRTAAFFLYTKTIDYDIRFDIISILLTHNRPPQIEHILNAFDFTE